MTGAALFDRELFSCFVEDSVTPEEHVFRLAGEIAAVDRRFEPLADVARVQERFSRVMQAGLFLPAPPALFEGARNNPVLFRETALSLSDDFGRLFEALRRASLYLQNRVKVALDFSPLRAARSLIRSSHLQSVGPVRFMELFERAPQPAGDKTPLSFLLNADHQDITDYLDYAERAPGHVRCAVGVTPSFAAALKSGGRLGLRHHPGGEISGEIPATGLYERCRSLALAGGISGFVFTGPLAALRTAAVPGGGALLNPDFQLTAPDEFLASGCLNLAAFTRPGGFDEEAFCEVAGDAVHFLDNCFERNFYCDEEARTATRRHLRLNLGVAGLGEALRALNPDGEARREAQWMARLAKLLRDAATRASGRLGEIRGARHVAEIDGATVRTRHIQTAGQAHWPLLGQLMNVPPYLFLRGMGFDDLLAMQRRHGAWQKFLGNVASFKHPAKGLDGEKFDALFSCASETGALTLEFA